MIWMRPFFLYRSWPARLALPCVILIMVLGSSCARKELVRQPALESYSGPVTAEVLKHSIGFRETRTIKALTDVRIFRNNEPAGSFSGVFGYQAPDSLKTSFFGPFGITVMEFLIAKEMLQVYVPPRNTLYEMRSPEISFSSLMNGKFYYTVQEQGDFYVLLAYDSAEKASVPSIKYLFDRTYLLNRRIIVYKEGEAAITIDFDGFNGKMPEKTKLSFSNGTEMEIALQEPEYDSDIPSGYFKEMEHTDKKVLPFQDLLKRFDPSR
ncbi:MAG: hypothetical protein HZB62_12035 [Nitrospirae bacterium]|nr:hypothetical protein [Nitrospirota bacterium]